MGMETTPPIMSTLNPNASVFVPAARPVVAREATTPAHAVPATTPTPPPPAPAVQEYSSEWWSRLETDPAFRDQYVSRCSFQSAEERDALLASLEELSDLDQFHGYQEHLVDVEEEEILARNLQELDCFLDEDLRLTDKNNAKAVEESLEEDELQKQQQQQQQQKAPWSRNQHQYQNKPMPQKVGSYPKKWNTYRLHQPRADM